jgi:hypothetical protein
MVPVGSSSENTMVCCDYVQAEDVAWKFSMYMLEQYVLTAPLVCPRFTLGVTWSGIDATFC